MSEPNAGTGTYRHRMMLTATGALVRTVPVTCPECGQHLRRSLDGAEVYDRDGHPHRCAAGEDAPPRALTR